MQIIGVAVARETFDKQVDMNPLEEGVPDRKNELEAFSCSFYPKHWSTAPGLKQRLCV